ncbi:hypothetical protein BKA58DRAFT_421071 [Alternaria rosae]|uniref:uncharacterized protein n=1 Tax=Alternaria rosae TaxID=1187941 RepID=UPI001E8DACD4|nr:uncharacterized protein BKA58DRAFT_421071 [Alternaria rosae]KAH6870557.1 hypothetical protein BKA58DRAFT_421071 [Alternaria rosae]
MWLGSLRRMRVIYVAPKRKFIFAYLKDSENVLHSGTCNKELLLGDIRALREAFREHFKDLRLHATVWKFSWAFIENLEGIRGGVDGTTINRNSLAEAPKPVPSTSKTRTLTSPTSTVSRNRVAPLDKPLSILLPSDSIIAREETQPNVAPLKRQRTDPGPSNAQAEVNSPVRDIDVPSQFATARNARSERVHTAAVPTISPIIGNIFAGFGSQRPSPVSATFASPCLWRAGEALQLNPALTHSPQTGPTHTTSVPSYRTLQRPGNGNGSQASPGSAPSARGAAEQSLPPRQSRISKPMPNPPQADYYILDLSNAPPQAFHQSRLPLTQLNATHTPFTPERTPAQFQQARDPESRNHPAPVVQMQPSMHSHTTSRQASQTNQTLQNDTPMSSRPRLIRQVGWEGVVASASPRMPSRQFGQTQQGASPAAPSPTAPAPASTIAASQPSGTKRKSVTRPMPAQYDGVIDLTSDNELEQERQNLLSSFMAKTAPAKQPLATATTVLASTQRKPIVIHDLDLDEDYARANNPCERLSNNPRAGLSGPKR